MSAIETLALRVATDHAARGTLEAAWLDAAGVVLGTSGLHRLVSALRTQDALPGVLTGLVPCLDLPDAPRQLAAAVAAMGDPDLSKALTVQLERARRHLALAEHLAQERPEDAAAERDQLARDLLAGRELP